MAISKNGLKGIYSHILITSSNFFVITSKQIQMWRVGEQYRLKRGLNGPIKHTEGIYSITTKVDCMKNSMPKRLSNDNVSGILEKVDTMNINDRDEKKVTQGDKLNQIKAQRTRTKPLGIPLYVL